MRGAKVDGKNRYQFDNVQVANLELLFNSTRFYRPPQVLVLNNKLNKCQSSVNNNCVSCCLRVAQPEFRRRSDVELADQSADCFANCSQRRAMNIELLARSQLSGKLVILGLTRIADRSDAGYLCQTLNSWSFIRFEPDDPLNDENHPDRNKQQSFFARSSQQQVASYSISALDIRWRPDGDLREMVTLDIQPGDTREQPDVQETLLVNQLECLSHDQKTINNKLNVHLLTLINRGNHTRNNQIASSKQQLADLAPESAIDHQSGLAALWPPRRRAIIDSKTAQQARNRSIGLTELISSPTTTISPVHHNETYRSQRAHHMLHQSTSSFIGPSYLVDLDSFGLKFRASSLLILLASSSFVILTYTICLLVYLRRATRRSKKCDRGSPEATGKKDLNDEHVLDISAPFNLQMPPATRTRLEMMLQSKRKRRAARKRRAVDSKRHLTFDARRDEMAKSTRDRAGQDGSLARAQTLEINRRTALQRRPFMWGAYGTLSAVAASLTKGSRPRNTRYRPNLNVIHESDLENLQQLQIQDEHLGAEKLVSATLQRQDQTNALYSSIQLSPNSYLASLVEDAMSLECSHTYDRAIYNQETLFARPFEQTTVAPSEESATLIVSSFDPVSRSRILRQVKQQDNHER